MREAFCNAFFSTKKGGGGARCTHTDSQHCHISLIDYSVFALYSVFVLRRGQVEDRSHVTDVLMKVQ